MENTKLKMAIVAQTKSITGALNIKVNEAPMYEIEQFVELLVNLGNIENFVEYCKYNENRLGLEYKTGIQKFNIFKREYEDKVVNKMLKNKMTQLEQYANELSEKIKKVTATYEDSERKRLTGLTNYKQLTFKSFGGYFSEEDVKHLEKIGSLGRCIEVQQSISGKDVLADKLLTIMSYKEKIEAKKIFRLGEEKQLIGSSKVQALLSKASGKVVA